MKDLYGKSDIDEISIGISKLDMCYRFGVWYIDMVICHIDMVILDIDVGYGLMMWEMTYRYGDLPYRYGISCHFARTSTAPARNARTSTPRTPPGVRTTFQSLLPQLPPQPPLSMVKRPYYCFWLGEMPMLTYMMRRDWSI